MSFLGTESKKTLVDGVPIYTIYHKNSPILIRFIFNAGSRFDEISGTSHFLEHLLVSSTNKFDSKDKIAKYFEQFGGSFSASVNSDFLKINLEFPDYEDFRRGAELIKSFFDKREFSQKIFNNEKQVIFSEILDKKNNPSKYVWDLNRKNIFAGTPLENPNTGTEESVSNLSLTNIYDHFDKYINQSRLNVIIAGDIKDDCIEIISESFHDIKKDKKNDINKSIDIVHNSSKTTEENIGSGKQTYVVFGLAIIKNLNSDESLSLNIFNNILGIGRGSRLLSILRYREPLVYSTYSKFNLNMGSSSLNIFFSSLYENVPKSIELIINEIKSIKAGISEEEFISKKKSMIKSLKIELETISSKVDFNEYLLKLSDNLTIDDYIDKIENLTFIDFIKTIKICIDENKFHTTICK